MKKFSAIISIMLIISMLCACTANKALENEDAKATSSSNTSSSASEAQSVQDDELEVEQGSSADIKTDSTTKKSQQSGAPIMNNQSSNNNPASENKPTQPKSTQPAQTTTKPAAQNEKYTTEEIYCKNGDLNIYGKMYKPNKSGKVPVVILSHSFGLMSTSLECYAKLLAEEGYAAYVFDFCGGSMMKNKSDGKKEDMTVFTEVSDLEAVLSKIRGLSYVDSKNVFLFGTSQGGLVSALVANNHNSQIKGMILLYPGFSMAEQVKNSGQMAGTMLSKKYIDAIKDYDIYGNIGGFKKDVLIIHGTKDTQVPISYSERALDIYSSATLVRIDGANHGFNSSNNFGMGGNFDSKVNPHIIEFMENHT